MPVQTILKAFDLTRPQSLEIATDFRQKLMTGLGKENSEIKCLPAYVFPSPGHIPTGISYVLDLGGSNLRAAVVSLEENAVRFLTPVKSMEMPWKRNVTFPKSEFLALQAGLLKSLDFPEACPLGYCFSYPAEALPDGDERLIRWTKGLHVPGTEGEAMGSMLTRYIRLNHPEIKINSFCVINDTVAGLFAGLTEEKTDAYIGLIVGTGTNTAALFSGDQVPKLKLALSSRQRIPINLESGNFIPPFLNPWDQFIDGVSENQGRQKFEKATSGLYLGRLFKAVFPDSDFDSDSGAKGLFRMRPESDAPEEVLLVAQAIRERSGKLVAAQLAGLIQVLADPSLGERIETVKIVAEGGLFWSEIHQRKVYAEEVETHLGELLGDLGLPSVKPLFRKINHANLIGAAIGALSK
jgi:hexokinase